VISCTAVHRGLLVTTGLCLGIAAGCPGLRAYVCAGDDDCDRGGQPGQCLADGACAYPDETCESGWVRSPNAADRPGACEPVPGSEGTGQTDSDGASGMIEGTGPADTGPTTDTGNPPACGSLVRLEVTTTFLSASEVLEGYPLLVSIEDPEIVAAIAASGEDPVVTDVTGALIAHELERLDQGAGTLALWVRLPAYALGEPLPLQLRWGGGQAAGDAAEVWAGRYAGVWHMGDAPSGIDGDEIKNSARIFEPGLTEGQMQPEQSVPGVVGRGLRFDGDDDAVTVDAEFVGQLDSYSISFWVLYDGPADGSGDYFQRLNGDYFYPRCWRQASGSVFCQYIVNETVTALGSGLEQDSGQLLHLAMVRDADAATHRLYVDGELVNENDDPAGATLPDDGFPFDIGRGELGTLPGVLDELRVSQEPLPPSWVRADYRTQLEPSAALGSVGGIEAVPCG
jgi:hypothetical protein